MAQLNLPWLVGRHLTSVVLTKLVEATSGSGVWTTSTLVATLTAKITNLSNNVTVQSAEINAMNSTLENTVSLAFGYPLSIEFLKATNSNPNPVYPLLDTGVDNYMQASWSEGITPNAQTFTIWGRFGGMEEPREGRGEKKISLNLEPADFGTATFFRQVA